jgi:enoyl-CoA hydratase
MSSPVTFADGRITLDDGKVNAFSVPTLRALHAALDDAEADAGAGPLVITGRPGRFSAGFDLGVFASGDGEAILEMLGLGARLCERLLGFPRPVIVAAPGHALAAGAFVLLAADVRIGVEGDFKIGLNESRIGMTLPWYVLALAEYRLSRRHLDEAVTLGTVYDPRGAADAGYLDRVVAPDALEAEIARTVEDLGALNADAFRGNKERLHRDVLPQVRDGAERSLAEIRAALAGAAA